jgi:ribosomal protein S8
MKLCKEYTKVTFLKTKDDPLYNFKHGVVSLLVESCEKVSTKRGEMLKVPLLKKNKRDEVLTKAYEISYTSEYMYIPMKYVMSIKEGVSTEDL